MYRLIKNLYIYLHSIVVSIFFFFDFPLPAVSFPDAVLFFDVFLQFFYFFLKQGNETGFSCIEIGLGKNSPIRSVSKRLLGPLTRRQIIRSGIRIGSDCR